MLIDMRSSRYTNGAASRAPMTRWCDGGFSARQQEVVRRLLNAELLGSEMYEREMAPR